MHVAQVAGRKSNELKLNRVVTLLFIVAIAERGVTNSMEFMGSIKFMAFQNI